MMWYHDGKIYANFFSYFFNARFKWYNRQLLENLTMKVEKQSMLRSYEIIRVLTLKYIYIYIYIGTRQQLYAWRKQKVQFLLIIYLFSTHVE